ncbi:hypothetical protein LHJ74_14270 [Streptomyces sp. N2-109]|uniref:Uncharacterized protein n=1 Tax=Streptomyces gossypii TaxID=2883101 RepID=A0ABT2JT92_9ACTN|nr:hypothetical protein [Streptomyces gossypii]MCT2591061.1 hypothetical protein [Streptomyces gossypii]
MLRHVIAPARFFSQVPNEIIRHPRLSSDAVRLLTWQLSLREDRLEKLSDTAARAGIRKTGFQRAKRQLLDEGYLHEWTEQNARGNWVTTQLVSSVPLTPAGARRARNGGGTASPADATAPEPQQPPSAVKPAAGEPTRRAVGRQPKKNTAQHTTDHPEAVRFLLGLARTDPRLAMPAATAHRWAPLAAPWLADGRPPEGARNALTRGLGDARSPLGALRWRLEHALPAPPGGPLPQPRIARMRECPGGQAHGHPRLFTPARDDTATDRCPDCRRTSRGHRDAPAPSSGLLAFRAARTSATRTTSGAA